MRINHVFLSFRKFVIFASVILLGIIFQFTYKPITTNASMEPITVIDNPRISEKADGDVLVRGWALNSAGIEKVRIFLDGKLIGETNLSEQRPDVTSAHPQYNQGNIVGYKYTIKTENASVGEHILTVEALGKDKISKSTSRNIIVFNGKWTPITVIDEPTTGSSVQKGTIKLRGWAINPSGVSKIKVYVDNKLIDELKPTINRSDVLQAFKQYKLPENVGYEYNLNLNSFQTGNRVITIEAMGYDGSSSTERRAISIKDTSWKPLVVIDSPRVNFKTGSNKMNIDGWSIHPNGIKKINLYVNDKLINSLLPNVARPDVIAVFRSYNLPLTVGYSYQMDISSLKNGANKLTVESISNNDVKITETRNFIINQWPNIVTIDSPRIDEKIHTNTLDIAGWAIAKSGVSKINILIDNKQVATLEPNFDRADVKNAYSSYDIPLRTGYSYKLDLASIPSGKHGVIVESIGFDGSVQRTSRNFYIERWQSLTVIDSPGVNSATDINDLKIRGWAINYSGVKSVKVLLDGVPLGEAKPVLNRADVQAAFKQYKLPLATGYEYTIPYNLLTVGNRRITVEAYGNDGSVSSESRNITIKSLPPLSNIETPSHNGNYNNTDVVIKGWALQNTKVKAVNIYLDNVLMGTTSANIARPDVINAHKRYKDTNSGFTFSISTNKIKPGKHRIKVEFVGTDGSKDVETRDFTMMKPSPIMNIETIQDGTIVFNTNINLSGWALNASDISEVKIYIDDVLKGASEINISRPDVGKAYPNYIDSARGGYNYKLNLDGLAIGEHTLKVIATGVDGTTQSLSRKFNLSGLASYVNYSKSLSYYSSREYNEGDPKVYISGSNERKATLDEINYYMNPNNFISNPIYKYMFLKLNYTEGINASNLNSLLNDKGILKGMGNAFLNSGKNNNINPIYLISHALLETGNGTSKLSKGILVTEVDGFPVTPKVVYNVYGYGAVDSGAIKYGAEMAYKQGWFSIEQAISGGAYQIGSGYINSSKYNQNTLYKMRYNLNDKDYWHQYATDIAWAYKQCSRIKSLIDQMNDPVLHFEVPVFK